MEIEILKLYLGCYAMHGDKRINVCGINVNSGHIQNIMCQETIPISEIKLILRPLSSMTEEEAFDWFKLGYTNDVAEIKVSKDSLNHRGISVDVKFLDSRSWRIFSLHTAKAEQFQYLLSKGFDLFGLIEKGEAIDSTKL